MLRKIVLLSVVGLSSLANQSWAGPVSESLAAQSKAYNEFYETFRASDDQSTEHAQRLSNAIIAPAETRVAKASYLETRWALLSSGLQFVTSSGPVAPSLGSVTPRPITTASRVAPLDGRNVPKVVVFPQASHSN